MSSADTGASRGNSAGRRKSGVIVPHVPTGMQRVLARLLYLLVQAVSLTIRYRWVDQTKYFSNKARGPAIVCIWHNRLALCLPIYNRFARRGAGQPGMAAMASASKDGAFLSAVLESFGVRAARGSSSRRGPQALLELTGWAERGCDLAITPDGPRGPRYVAQPGVISLAQVTGLPILPSCYNLSRKIRVKSWDAFQVPLPFSRCDVVIGPPMFISRDATDAEREKARSALEGTLRDLAKD